MLSFDTDKITIHNRFHPGVDKVR